MTIKHNCDNNGCYVKTKMPDWGFLDSAFSGNIRVGDIDGGVEANGCLLILEWKGFIGDLNSGQRIMFEKITEKNKNITVFVVSGDPEKTISNHIKIYKDGVIVESRYCTNDILKELCSKWEHDARDLDHFTDDLEG